MQDHVQYALRMQIKFPWGNDPIACKKQPRQHTKRKYITQNFLKKVSATVY